MTKVQISILSMVGLLVVGGAVVGVSSAVTASRDKQDAEGASVSDSLLEASGTQAAQPETDTQAGEQSPETAPPAETQAPTQGVTPTQAPTSQPTTQPAPTQPEKITFEYDAELSAQVAQALIAKRPELVYDPALFVERHPENAIKETGVTKANNTIGIIDEFSGSNVAQQIVDAWWPNIYLKSTSRDKSFCLGAYRYSNGMYYVALCPAA